MRKPSAFMDFGRLRDLYRNLLLQDVLPFWMRHAIDPSGAINTCIADDGRVQSRDRWSWSQWRAVWVWSKLYNTVDARPEWLKVARGICRFATEHGPLENGHWPLLLDSEGIVQRGYESIYADGFAIYGLVESWRATRDPAALDLARETFQGVEKALAADEPPPAWPYPIPRGTRAHGVSMLFSLAYHELAEATGAPEVRAAAELHHEQVMQTFLRPGGLVLERLREDGGELPAPEGTVVVPGHAIESMWFQMHLSKDRKMRDRACRAILRHLEIGWDPEVGGLFLAVDAGGRKDVAWPFADSKLWWPHTEALYATLLAYEHTRDERFLEWHERVRAWSFDHFPVAQHGEWRQRLDRRGKPFDQVVALPVKDPFHLPRALIYCVEVLDRLAGEKP
jgi:N-acylglucosamine 2-epimerase